MTTVAAAACANCRAAMTSLYGAAPWCPRCERGLDTFEPGRRTRELAGAGWIESRSAWRTA
ncbi:MAG TPA: hypothetical protein VHI50_11695 [Micromonosporaceae bacterium]|nr:hypothetical protein [Micromonosporaceae bacterium]